MKEHQDIVNNFFNNEWKVLLVRARLTDAASHALLEFWRAMGPEQAWYERHAVMHFVELAEKRNGRRE